MRVRVRVLKRSQVSEDYSTDIGGWPPVTTYDGHWPEDNIEKQCRGHVFRDVVYSTLSTVFEHLTLAIRKTQDWFDENDEEIQALLSEKQQLFEHSRMASRHNQRKMPLQMLNKGYRRNYV